MNDLKGIAKMKKRICLDIENPKVIDVFDNPSMYYIPNNQMGFSSQRQLIEIAIEFMLDQSILIKREGE